MSLPLLALLLAARPGAHPLPGAFPRHVFRPMPVGRMNEIIADQVLVKLRPSKAEAVMASAPAPAAATTNRAMRAVADALVPGGQPLRRIGKTGWTLWRLPAGANPEAAAEALREDPEVLSAQAVNRVYPLIADPNDSDWDAYEDSEDLILSIEGDIEPFRRLWHIVDSNAQAAWSIWPNRYYTSSSKPADPPLIAVIDTGCDMDHPDFVNAGGSSTDSAQGGQLDKALSARFELGDLVEGSPEDRNGHGTHVAGIALAAGNNGGYNGADDGEAHGTIGTGYPCKGMILRVFDDAGIGTDADAAAAIYYAVDHGADVINLSLGTENFSQLFQDAVTYAFQAGTLVVCAGNEDGGGGGDLGPIYPAACSGALGVSANGPDGTPATDNYGGTGTYVDVSAPGGNVVFGGSGIFGGLEYKIQYVWSTSSRDPNAALNVYTHQQDINPKYNTDYSYLAGTSMATPGVSGAMGLYYGKNGLDQKTGWANLRAYRAVEKSATAVLGAPRGTWEPTQGYGALNMEDLLLDNNERGATVGACEGIVYYNGTALANVTVRAQKAGSKVKYQTSTRPDGGYRFEVLPPGVYSVTAIPFGAAKSKSVTVVAGSDQPGVDFWGGTYTGDETLPTVGRFDLSSYTATGFSLRHWAYDTETGIDRMSVRIGKTPGAADVLADTEVFPESPVVTQTGLTIPKFNTLQARYVNGAGMTTTVTRAVVPLSADAFVRDGSYAATNYGTSGVLGVRNNAVGYSRKTYLKFDTSGIPGALGSVKLRLWAVKWGGTAALTGVSVYPTTSGWTETGLTWNNAPAAGGAALANLSITPLYPNYTAYDVDVTAYVRAERAAGRPVVSLLLACPRDTDGAEMASREYGTYAPQLIVSAQG